MSPLVLDYVKSESRGLGVAYTSIGSVIGELFMVAIFVATRVLMVAEQFWLVGLSLGAISLILIFLIREPTIKKDELD